MEHYEDDETLLCPKTDGGVSQQTNYNNSTTTTTTSSNNGGVNGGRNQKKKKMVKEKEKEKPVKIQQRGLGVAELEKRRLLEEQNTTNNNNGGVLISTSPLNNRNRSSLSAPLHPPFFTNTTHHTLHNHPHYLNLGEHDQKSAMQHFTGISCPNEFYQTEGNNNNNHSSSDKSGMLSLYNSITSDGANQAMTYCYSPTTTVNHVAASSSMTVLNYQTELPSNQSHYGGTYRSVQLDDAEMNVGTKRQHLLSPHELPDQVADYYCKYNPFIARHGLERSSSLRAPAPQGQGSSFATNNGNLSLREGLQSSLSMPNLKLRKDTNTGGAASVDGGGFPELGSLATMPFLSGSNHQAGLKNLDTTIYQVYTKGSNVQGGSNCNTNHHHHHHQQQQQEVPIPNSQPASNNAENGQSEVETNHTNGDAEDKLDLSLRL